jgi:hypothetical protein
MSLSCPRCQTAFVARRRRAQTAAAALGGVAGAIQGAASAMAVAERGSIVEGASPPLGLIAGALLAGLLGGATGCAIGSEIGAPIDEFLPDKFRCQACGHTFDAKRSDPTVT